ncbi:hypothetical protein ACWCOP_01075 [Maricaulaceae bacterium MS644]
MLACIGILTLLALHFIGPWWALQISGPIPESAPHVPRTPLGLDGHLWLNFSRFGLGALALALALIVAKSRFGLTVAWFYSLIAGLLVDELLYLDPSWGPYEKLWPFVCYRGFVVGLVIILLIWTVMAYLRWLNDGLQDSRL